MSCISNGALKLSVNVSSSYLASRTFYTAPVFYGLGAWRLKNNLPAKGKEYGPLTDLPDWSYADGRPAPLAEKQKKRIVLHKNYCEQIIKLSKEVDKCFELNKQKAAMEEQKRQRIIQNRLKTKGKSVI